MQNESTNELPEFLDTKELKTFKLTSSWATKNRVYATGDDLLPFIKIGGKVLYRTATVRAWLAAREQRGETRAAPAPARAGDRTLLDDDSGDVPLRAPRRGRRRGAA